VPNRTATSSLKGYAYQFRKTFNEILHLKEESDFLEIEGVEDIDVTRHGQSTYVQVKHLTASKLLPSSVKHPISLMLADHVGRPGTKLSYYKLYAFFGDDSGTSEFLKGTEFFERILEQLVKDGKVPTSTGVKKTALAFKKIFSLEIGEAFDVLESKIKSQLKSKFSASDSEVESFLFPLGIEKIFSIALNPSLAERRVTKAEFFNAFRENRSRLYGVWQRQKLGIAKFINSTKDILSAGMKQNRKRLIYVDVTALEVDETGYEIESLIHDIAQMYSPIGKLKDVVPITIVISAPAKTLGSIKRKLISENIFFNDGYEEIEFSPYYFENGYIFNVKAPNGNKVKSSSFSVRLISAQTYNKYESEIERVQTAICVTNESQIVANADARHIVTGLHTFAELRKLLT